MEFGELERRKKAIIRNKWVEVPDETKKVAGPRSLGPCRPQRSCIESQGDHMPTSIRTLSGKRSSQFRNHLHTFDTEEDSSVWAKLEWGQRRPTLSLIYLS
jgi:hypothetical protein